MLTHIFWAMKTLTCVCKCVCQCWYSSVQTLYILCIGTYKVAHTHLICKKNNLLVSSVQYSSFRIHIGTFCTCPKPSCNVQVNVKPSSTSLYLGWLELRYNTKYTHLHLYTKSFSIYLGLQFFSIPNISLSLIHIWRCRRSYACRSRWSPYH